MKSFYFKQDSNYDKEYGKKDWLYLNNFGYYFNVPKDVTTARVDLRADYHLLYVSSGEISVNDVTLKNGDAYLFLPWEKHIYTYKRTENSRYFWFHFTGNKAPDILSHCEIIKGFNRDNGRGREKNAILSMLIEEISVCHQEATEFAVTLFFSFLSLFKGKENKKNYAKALKQLENTHDDVSVEEIAGSYSVTPSHFIRSFKSVYGITPNEYKQNHRISLAINLIKSTNLSIQDIAYQCGFSDPLYFSRFFKKRLGVSPLKYRSQK